MSFHAAALWSGVYHALMFYLLSFAVQLVGLGLGVVFGSGAAFGAGLVVAVQATLFSRLAERVRTAAKSRAMGRPQGKVA